MELIQDLGIKARKGGYRERFGLNECPICKKHFEVSTKSVKRGLSTKCKSCAMSIISRKHSKSNHPLYDKFFDMRTRCYNDKSKAYENYGKKGIQICDEWLKSPISFIEWGLKNGYEKGLQIDRINPEGNYEPSNCRFVNKYENAQNKKKRENGATYKKSIGKWSAYINNNGIRINLGYYNNKEDALIAYDLYVIDNKTKHPINIVTEGFNRKEWEDRIKEERRQKKERNRKIVSKEEIEMIKQSTMSAYKLAKQMPYSKSTILKIRRGLY